MITGLNKIIATNNYKQQNAKECTVPSKTYSAITRNQKDYRPSSIYYAPTNINFSGKYDPTRKEMANISQALKGCGGEKIKGPNYFAPTKIVRRLYEFIHSGKKLDNETILFVSQKRAETHNNFVLTKIDAPLKSAQDFLPETQKFVSDLKNETTCTQKTLSGLGLNKSEIKIFNKFAAATASTLFQMGYPEAMAHSSQVARKCAIEASGKTKNSTEILKSAMVGCMTQNFQPIFLLAT